LSEEDLVPLRQGQRLNTTEIKCSKIAYSSRWGKRARHHRQKSTTKIQAKRSSQMHECKLPLNKCISPKFSFLDANSPWKHELGTFLPLVGNAWIKSTSASMCFSNKQRPLQHAKIET
jgi:hypothetical protein